MENNIKNLDDLSKGELFIELAKPNDQGISEWVSVDKFVGPYARLITDNGVSWARKESSLAKKYVVEFDRSITKGMKVDRIRLNGFRNINTAQTIRQDIKNVIKQQNCAVLATSHPEVDHKNGRKNDIKVLTLSTQTIQYFQPLSKAANDAKRQHCKDCKQTNKRFDARCLGYTIGWTIGTELHDGTINGCIGCNWYDPKDFNNKVSENVIVEKNENQETPPSTDKIELDSSDKKKRGKYD